MGIQDLAFLIFKEITKLKSALKEKESDFIVKELESHLFRQNANREIEQAQLKLLRLESAVNVRGAMGKEEKDYVLEM